MNVPVWALALVYWLHMLATVVWIGGLTAVVLLVIPAGRRSLNAEAYASLLGDLQRRLDPLAWFSLVLLAGTGLIQMSANPNYEGFLTFGNRWAVAILLKHLVFLAMTGLSAYLTWGVLPGLRRLALRQARYASAGENDPAAARLQEREVLLLRVNLALGIVVLALTALARAS
jgi:uncharacterized membrane protein